MTDGDGGEPEDPEALRRGREGGAATDEGSNVDVESGSTDARSDEDDGPSAGGETVEPVEVLVGLAEAGEIEPWDIDIVAVTDAFLAELDAADLRGSGRALFYASVLLRMKSDALLDDEPETAEPEPEPWEGAWNEPVGEGGPAGDPIDALEAEMDRRLERKRARGTPETLDELVRELREAERDSRWKESREYDTSDSPRGFRRGTQTLDYRSDDDLRVDEEPTEADVTGTAHAEDIEATIADVERALRGQYDAGREEVLYAEIESAGGSRVETFLALLFLAHRGRVRLEQDELFGDLWVQNPATTSAPEGALAD
jgi:segregation and condensation protein A